MRQIRPLLPDIQLPAELGSLQKLPSSVAAVFKGIQKGLETSTWMKTGK